MPDCHTEHILHLREHPGSKGPAQIQGDCNCLPSLPGEGVPTPPGAQLLHLKHSVDVGVLGLHQFPPGSEVAIGEDAPWLQQAKSVALGGGQRSGEKSEKQVEEWVPTCVWMADTPTGLNSHAGGYRPHPSTKSYLDEVELVCVPGFLGQWIRVIQDPCMGRQKPHGQGQPHQDSSYT